MKNKKDIINILISMSNNLDRKGYHKEADRVDFLIRKVAEDLADDLESEFSEVSESQKKLFDLDKKDPPFSKSDFNLLREKKKLKSIRKKRLK